MNTRVEKDVYSALREYHYRVVCNLVRLLYAAAQKPAFRSNFWRVQWASQGLFRAYVRPDHDHPGQYIVAFSQLTPNPTEMLIRRTKELAAATFGRSVRTRRYVPFASIPADYSRAYDALEQCWSRCYKYVSAIDRQQVVAGTPPRRRVIQVYYAVDNSVDTTMSEALSFPAIAPVEVSRK